MSGKKHIMEIDTKFNFKEDPTIRDTIIKATYFDPQFRISTVSDFIKLMGGKPKESPIVPIDFSIKSPFLVVEDGSAKGAMYPLTIEDGSSRQLERKNLDATNNSISKKHAMMYRKENRYFIYDTGSKNGSFLNGSKVGIGKEQMVEVKHADRIRFADLWTRFVFLKK
jgi:hypothetical protein